MRRDRARSAAVAVGGLGLAVHLYSVSHVLEAGGLTVTSELGACAEAATARWTTAYRLNEQLVVDHGFLPPSATCRWSGGSEAALAPPTWTWSGVVLAGFTVLALLVLSLTPARAGRPQRAR